MYVLDNRNRSTHLQILWPAKQNYSIDKLNFSKLAVAK